MKTPRAAAMDYLARREHTRVELHRKLAHKGYELVEIDEALTQLQAQGLQSDQRFAESFIAQRARHGHGPIKIIAELKQHGVDDALIDRLMRQATIDWNDCARFAWQKKFGRAPSDAQQRAKQQRFMMQRGFCYENFVDLMT